MYPGCALVQLNDPDDFEFFHFKDIADNLFISNTAPDPTILLNHRDGPSDSIVAAKITFKVIPIWANEDFDDDIDIVYLEVDRGNELSDFCQD